MSNNYGSGPVDYVKEILIPRLDRMNRSSIDQMYDAIATHKRLMEDANSAGCSRSRRERLIEEANNAIYNALLIREKVEAHMRQMLAEAFIG
jgi:hypothetical protein